MSSLDFNLWTELSFDSDEGECETFLNREAIISESHNGTLNRVHGYKWTDVLTPKITFIKRDYENFTADENRRILSWLTSSAQASFLDIYNDDSEVIAFCVLGNFVTINQHKLANGRIVGYTAEFESVSPFAFSPLRTVTKTISDSTDNKITINVDTDDPQAPIYPRITIVENAGDNVIAFNKILTNDDTWIDGSIFEYGGIYYWFDAAKRVVSSSDKPEDITTTSVSIQNKYTPYGSNTSRTFNTIIKKNIMGEKIILDGANKVISSSRMDGRIFGDDFTNWQWIPLYHGENELSFVGNCTVTIDYRTPIKCGEF